jgi:hypothetical protein
MIPFLSVFPSLLQFSEVLIHFIQMAEEQSWTLVREALAGIADLANQYGSQGIDLHFLHHHDFHKNIKVFPRLVALSHSSLSL